MKKILCLFFLIVLLLPACAPVKTPPPPTPTATPAAQPWAPASAADVNQLASAFEKLIRTQEEGYKPGNQATFLSIYADNAVFKDDTYGDGETGAEAIYQILAYSQIYFPNWKQQITEGFIAGDGGAALENDWDLMPDNYQFTQDDPQKVLSWLKLKDNLIKRWLLMYGLDSMEKGGSVEKSILDYAQGLLSSYQSAWSSGDPNQVAKLYAASSVRNDSIFGRVSEGSNAVSTYATTFFTQFPGAKWTLSQGYGEGGGPDPLVSGLFVINVPGTGGQPCEVRTIVILASSEGQINQEDVFHDPQSLIACGWAQ